MTTLELEVLQDFVKIGLPIIGTILGATIGAIATYKVTKLSHEKELGKEILVRRMNLIEEIGEEFAKFTDVVAKHYAESELEHSYKIKNEAVPDLVNLNLETIAQMLHDTQPKLKRIESRLLILGLESAYQAILKYVNELDKFRNSVLSDAEPMSKEGFHKYLKSLGDLEIQFYGCLRKGYKNA